MFAGVMGVGLLEQSTDINLIRAENTSSKSILLHPPMQGACFCLGIISVGLQCISLEHGCAADSFLTMVCEVGHLRDYNSRLAIFRTGYCSQSCFLGEGIHKNNFAHYVRESTGLASLGPPVFCCAFGSTSFGVFRGQSWESHAKAAI